MYGWAFSANADNSSNALNANANNGNVNNNNANNSNGARPDSIYYATADAGAPAQYALIEGAVFLRIAKTAVRGCVVIYAALA